MDFLKLKKHEAYAFVATVVTSFVAYGYRITHNQLTYDSLWNIYSDQDMLSSGRQFLTYACKISSDYALPWLNGLLAFFYLALTAIVLVRIFDVEKNVTAILIGIVLASFPSVSNTFVYSYTVDGYMLAVLLATLSVYFAKRFRFGFAVASVLLCLSIGIYQAYFPYAMVLFIVLLILDAIFKDDIKKILWRALNYFLTVVIGYVLYVITLKIMLAVKGGSLSGYQGSDKVLSIGGLDVFAGIKAAFVSFKDFALYANVLTTTGVMKISVIVVALICCAEVVYLFVSQKRYKDVIRVIAVLFLAAITPICSTVFVILSPGTLVHLLMRMSWVGFFIFAVVLSEKMICAHKWETAAIKASYLFLAVMAFEFAVVSNIVGFNLNERYEKTYAMSVRILDKLEECPGYRHGMKVAILGGFPSEESYPDTDITVEDLSGYFGVAGSLCANSTAKYAEFMKHYLGVTITEISEAEEIALTETQEFKDMEYFPYEGSITQIGDVWVIKLNG